MDILGYIDIKYYVSDRKGKRAAETIFQISASGNCIVCAIN